MSIVFSAKLTGSEVIPPYPIALAAFYVREARRYARANASMPEGEKPHFAEALLAVLLSVFLGAFSNEIADGVISGQELAAAKVRGEHSL